MRLVVYACDIGVVKKGNFGWVRAVESESDISGDDSIDHCVLAMQKDIDEGRSLAFGFECPLFIPIPLQSNWLWHPRVGEGNLPWCGPIGATVAMIGLQQLAFILRRLKQRAITPVLDWKSWVPKSDTILLWEAFVSGKAHSEGHVRDAATAAQAFLERLANKPSTDVSVQAPSEVYSLAGLAVLWAGWSQDLKLLRWPVLVVKPSQPYEGPIRPVGGAR